MADKHATPAHPIHDLLASRWSPYVFDDRPVSVPDFLATVCLALGIDPRKQNPSNVGRPIRIADPDAKPLREALA